MRPGRGPRPHWWGLQEEFLCGKGWEGLLREVVQCLDDKLGIDLRLDSVLSEVFSKVIHSRVL